MLLMKPQCFQQVVCFDLIVRVEIFAPLLCCSNHSIGVSSTELHACSMSYAINGMLQVLEQGLDGLTRDFDWFL